MQNNTESKGTDAIHKALDDLKSGLEPKAGDKRAASYADRVRRWWNSRLHGTRKSASPEGASKVECSVRYKATGKVVVRAEGNRTMKRSAQGAARARAVSELFSFVKRAKGGKRVHVDLGEYEFEYRTLEV